jgi:hypothetical protein
MQKLRKCKVRIPARKEYAYSIHGVAEMVLTEAEEHDNCLFHCWHEKKWVVDESPMIGGHPGGQMSAMFGVVEYSDGSIHLIAAEMIQFVKN